MIRREFPNGVVCLVSPLLERIGVPHAFSTRIGGVSSGPFASLNFGNPMDSPVRDPDTNLNENYARLLQAIGLGGKPLSRLHQVHGSDVVTLRPGDPPARHQKADALVTDSPELPLSIRTADCVPILLASADGRWVAAIHAGWRGVVAGVLPATFSTLADHGVATSDIVVAIGPCIGLAAFEVGEEVAAEFRRVFGDAAPVSQHPGHKPHVDLCAAVALQAQRCGVPAPQIDPAFQCTVEHADLFFSHRRDNGLTGRMAAIIAASA